MLLVDCGVTDAPEVRRACQSIAQLECCRDFPTARRRLLDDAPRLLVTNLRLEAYNGLHLVYLARTSHQETRSIVYSNHLDLPLIEEAQAAGAFYEPWHRIPYALAGYVLTVLPPRDRRSPLAFDRRGIFRGGRRAADVTVTTA